MGRNLSTTILIVLALVVACTSVPRTQSFIPSSTLSNYTQPNFVTYVEDTYDWLQQNRAFISDQKQLELETNMPFERKPATSTNKAVLLVHGLGDSPYSFNDLADRLVQQGFLVRTILLPGHGSRPADLMLPTEQDWSDIVAHHTALLKKDAGEVWLGGFSTGANLVTQYALNDPDIEGLLLFSPAFKSSSKLVRFASLVEPIWPWADVDKENNILRYNSLPTKGGALYYETAKIVSETLKSKVYEKPTFIALSETDSVVDIEKIRSLFNSHFTNPNSQLLWFGNSRPETDRIHQFSMNLPDLRVSTGSHMNILYSPANPHYGPEGDIRICENGQGEEAELACENGADIWYSSYGYREEGKIYGRLTWNPYFNEMIEHINQVVN